MTGVVIFKGMKIGFLPGDLLISFNDGDSKAVLSTSYNVIPIFMKIAKDALKQSKSASEEISKKWDNNPDHQIEMLLAELAPSMQVIISCGICLDALYDTLRPNAKISAQDIEKWKDNRTSRRKQILEVIRRTYNLKNQVLNNFKEGIYDIIKHRDMAVHPSIELQNAIHRPDINIGVDWKFAVYSFSNAERWFNNTIKILGYLYDNKAKIPEVDENISNIIDALIELKVVKLNY